jgi:MFS family permease
MSTTTAPPPEIQPDIAIPHAPSRLTTGQALASLILLLALGLVCVIDAGVLAALLTPIKADLKLSDEHFGRMASAFSLVGILAIPVYGFLSTKFSRKSLILVGLVLWSFAAIGSGWSAGFGALLIWRALVSFGEAGYDTLVPSWLADLYGPQWRNFVFTLYMLRNKVGGALSLLLGGWLAASYDWHVAFFVTGAPGLVLALALFFIREPRPGESDGRIHAVVAPTLRESLSVLRYPGFILHSIALSFHYSGMSLHLWQAAYLHRVFGLTNFQATSFLGSTIVFTLPAGLIGGFLTGLFFLGRHRAGYATLMTFTELLTFIFYVVVFTTRDLIVAKIFIVLGMCAFGFSAGSMTTLIVETVPSTLRVAATTVSLIFTGLVGRVIASEVIGLLSDHYGLARAVYFAPAAYLLATISWGILAAWQRRNPGPEELSESLFQNQPKEYA